MTAPVNNLSTNSTAPNRRFWYATLCLVALYFIAFSVFTIGRYDHYNATGFDLAFYDNILYRTVHGNIMGLGMAGVNGSNWAYHVEPILILLAPFKLIFTDVRWLLIFQTACLALAAIPVYWIAVRQWRKGWIGFVFALLYLIFPSTGWANKFDFHPLVIATPLLFFAFDSAERGRFRLVSLLLLLAMFCKEEMGLVVACFGLYWYFSPAKWRGGLFWGIGGIAWTLLGFFVIIPGAQQRLLLPVQAFRRYDWIFTGTLADKIAYITGPDTAFKIRFLIQLVAPFFFTPLLKPHILFIASPIVLLSVLSTVLNQSGLYHHYMAAVIPFLVIAAIKGAYSARIFMQKRGLRPGSANRILFAGMLSASIAMFIAFNPFTVVPTEPYAPIYGWEPGASLVGLQAAEAFIPPDSCLIASNNIAAHYGQRWVIRILGDEPTPSCDLALIDLADNRYPMFGLSSELSCYYYSTFGFRPIFYQDNVVVLKQHIQPDANLDNRFRAFCAALKPAPTPQNRG